MHNSNEVTQMCPQRHSSPKSKYHFAERIPRTCMDFEGELVELISQLELYPQLHIDTVFYQYQFVSTNLEKLRYKLRSL